MGRRSYDDEEYAAIPAPPIPADEVEWDPAAAAIEEAAPAAPRRRPGPPARLSAEDEEELPFEPAPRPRPAPARPARRPPTPPPAGARPPARPGPPAGKGARRVQVAAAGRAPARRPIPRLPIMIAVAVLLLLLTGGVFVGLNNGGSPGPGGAGLTAAPNGLAATVNGKPITMAAYNERLTAAKQNYIDQFGLNFDNVAGGGPRMADALGFDVLDQMINFEVLMQEAQKESIIPNPTQVEQRYQDARKAADQQHMTWDSFIQTQGATTDAQFRQSIVDAFTYLIIADQHTQQATSDTDKQAALATYICSTRAKYDVKVYVQFIIPQTPCSSAGSAPGAPAPNITVPPRSPVVPAVDTSGPGPIAPATATRTR
ncbi:MAG TPA: SurA N-terminal domain-containing protein [Chloroflexia bacterium]|nr:SurA N-terminal domain-containing protein [Chloroflexia bacterium]